jgi:solute carrier family 25 iron transporter 28/37
MSEEHKEPEQETTGFSEYFEWEEREADMPYFQHVLAGSAAGVIEHCSLLPIDIIKTHQQVSLFELSFKQSAKLIYETGGHSKFWRGSSIMMAGCIPAHAIFFSIYEFSRYQLHLDNSDDLNFFLNAMTGLISTAFHDLIMTPCEVLKQRAQLNHEMPMRQIAQGVVHQEGIRALWRSYPISYMMNLPSAAVIVSCNEALKQMWRNRKHKHNTFTYFGCASISGALASLVTIPFDNIRTRMNTQCDLVKCDPTVVTKNLGIATAKGTGSGAQLAAGDLGLKRQFSFGKTFTVGATT